MKRLCEKYLTQDNEIVFKYFEKKDPTMKMIPTFLSGIWNGILASLTIFCSALTEDFLSSTRQIMILVAYFVNLLLNLLIFFLLKKKLISRREKVWALTAFARVICALSLSYTFYEGKAFLKTAFCMKTMTLDLFQLLSQLSCLFYFLSIQMNFDDEKSLKTKSLIKAPFLVFWCFYEIFATFKGNFNSIACTLITFILILGFDFFYGAIQVRNERRRRLNEGLVGFIMNNISQNLVVLNKHRQLAYASRSATINFGLKDSTKDSIINWLLKQKIKHCLKSNETNKEGIKITKEFGSRKKIIKKALINSETINQLIEKSDSGLIESKGKYLVELPLYDFLDGNIFDTNNQTIRITQTEERPLAEEFHESQKKKTPFSLQLLRLCYVEGETLHALFFDNLLDSKDLLEESETLSLKNNLLKSFSHEIHTALNGSLSLIDCAIDDPWVRRETKESYLNQTQTCLKTLKYFLNDVIDYLKFETQELALERGATNSRDILTEMDCLMKAKCQEKGLVFTTKVAHLEPDSINTDTVKLKQILANLLNTSLKHTFHGEICLQIRDSPRYRGCVEFEVEDTRFLKPGYNSSEDKCSSVEAEDDVEFRKFMAKKLAVFLSSERLVKDCLLTEVKETRGVCYRLILEKNTQSEDSVIGSSPKLQSQASLFKSLVARSEKALRDGGSFEKKSDYCSEAFVNSHELKESASFYVEKQFMKIRRLASLNQMESQNIIKKKEVLIVDDDPFNLLSIELILKRENYSCHKAFNGNQALNFLREYYSKPSSPANSDIYLIFMDLNMPEMDGLTCSREINSMIERFELPQIPIIGCSANDTLSDIEACESAGMSGFISKPLTVSKIRQIIFNLYKLSKL